MGKTTQARRLLSSLKKLGHEVLFIEEFSDSPMGNAIRCLLQDPFLRMNESCPTRFAETLLLLSNSAYQEETIIRPVLLRGKTVVIDRYLDSHICYQIPLILDQYPNISRDDLLHWFDNLFIWTHRLPDITFVLNLPSGDLRERLSRRDDYFYSKQDFNLLLRVAKEYVFLASRFPERVIMIDAAEPAGTIEKRILEATVNKQEKSES